MYVGKAVVYVDAKGGKSPAVVAAIVGAGASEHKTLNLTVDGKLVTSVPHGKDRVKGEPYWLLPGEKLTRAELAALAAGGKAAKKAVTKVKKQK